MRQYIDRSIRDGQWHFNYLVNGYYTPAEFEEGINNGSIKFNKRYWLLVNPDKQLVQLEIKRNDAIAEYDKFKDKLINFKKQQGSML